MSYDVKILADSISPSGVRIVTIQATHPRFILAKWNTHRVFGRNSASSRAIPPEKIIEVVQHHPFVPDFNKRVKGMGFGEALNVDDAKLARQAWLNARDKAVQAALVLIDLDVDKARINRLLEPFMWHTSITTATEWTNFLALRQPGNDDPVPQSDFPAQPEFQVIARMVRDAMRASTPVELSNHDWHLPLVSIEELTQNEKALTNIEWARVSAGRCARVSFDKHGLYEDPNHSLVRFSRLVSSGHWSALEHTARPLSINDYNSDLDEKISFRDSPSPASDFVGHLRGWVCLRKFYAEEHDRSLTIARMPEVERL